MVSERLRQLLLRAPKAASRRQLWRPAARPMTLIRGLKMGPTGCVCRLSLMDIAPVPGNSSTSSPQTTESEPTRAPAPQLLREELVVLPEMVPRVEVRAPVGDFDHILRTRQLPAQRLESFAWRAAGSNRGDRRRPTRLGDAPRLSCPLAARQLCARCPWMAVGARLSVEIKTEQFAAALRAALPRFLPYLCDPATARGGTGTSHLDGSAHPRDVIVEEDDDDAQSGDLTPKQTAPHVAALPAAHERQIQLLPVDYREGVAVPLQGNHLQELYFGVHRAGTTAIPASAGTARGGSELHFVPLTADDASAVRRRRHGQHDATPSADALRRLSRTQTEDPAVPSSSLPSSSAPSAPSATACVDDGLGLCGLATLEQKRLLPLLNEWAARLPLATQACVRGAVVLQVPSTTRARQAWSSSLLVTLLMEKDVVGWGPQSPLCGPSHPADLLSVMEQELVEAVLTAAPLVPDVRVHVGFLSGNAARTGSGGWSGREADVLAGDWLHPEVMRGAALTRDQKTDRDRLDASSSTAQQEMSDARRSRRASSSMTDEEETDAASSVMQPLACYIDASDQLVETALPVTASVLEVYTLNAALADSAGRHARQGRAGPSRPHTRGATLASLPFFRHAASLDTACSVLLSALLESSGPSAPSPSHVWLQLGDWQTDARPTTASGVADARVASKRLGEALVAVLDEMVPPSAEGDPVPSVAVPIVAQAHRWHRREGRELPLRERDGSDAIAPIIARRRATTPAASRAAAGDSRSHATSPRLSLLCVLPCQAEAARAEARSVVKWLAFVEATLLPLGRSPPAVRVVLASCTGDGDAAPLLAALHTICEQSGMGLPLDEADREASRRLRLDGLSTSVVDMDPLSASSVLYTALDLSIR